jgi:large subunit ribosomal protein L28e
MVSLPSDLLWGLLADHNSFLVRRDNKEFSSDPFNLLNVHTQQYAGIAHNGAVGVSARKSTKDPVVLRLKKLRKYGEPKKTGHQTLVSIKRGGFTGTARKALEAKLGERQPSLIKTALLRVKKLHDSEKPKKAVSRNLYRKA